MGNSQLLPFMCSSFFCNSYNFFLNCLPMFFKFTLFFSMSSNLLHFLLLFQDLLLFQSFSNFFLLFFNFKTLSFSFSLLFFLNLKKFFCRSVGLGCQHICLLFCFESCDLFLLHFFQLFFFFLLLRFEFIFLFFNLLQSRFLLINFLQFNLFLFLSQNFFLLLLFNFLIS